MVGKKVGLLGYFLAGWLPMGDCLQPAVHDINHANPVMDESVARALHKKPDRVTGESAFLLGRVSNLLYLTKSVTLLALYCFLYHFY